MGWVEVRLVKAWRGGGGLVVGVMLGGGGEEGDGTCMLIWMAAASLASMTSVPSLAWSRSSQVQSVEVSAPFSFASRWKYA